MFNSFNKNIPSILGKSFIILYDPSAVHAALNVLNLDFSTVCFIDTIKKFCLVKPKIVQKTVSEVPAQAKSVASTSSSPTNPIVSEPVGDDGYAGLTTSENQQTTKSNLKLIIDKEMEKNQALSETIPGMSCKCQHSYNNVIFHSMKFCFF